MTITFVQRSIIIFAILLCYYQSWASLVDCERQPYHRTCRGSQARKRLAPLPIFRAIDCEEGDCRLPRMKYLIAILDDNPNRGNEVHPARPDQQPIHPRPKQSRMMRMEDSQDLYMDY